MHFEYCPYCGRKLELKEIGDEGMLPYCVQCETPLWDMFTTSVICEDRIMYPKQIMCVLQGF